MSNMLGPEETLNQNASLFSANKQYELRMQDDGNLVLYRTADKRAIWNAWESTEWQVADRPRVAALKMQDDGNLVIYSQGRALWDTDTHGPISTRCLILQDDGKLAIREIGTSLWERAVGQ